MADDGDDSTSHSMSPDSMDEERPLKKARYVWQIKGRYRLGHSRGRHSCSQSSQQPVHPPASAQPLEQDQECPILRWQTRQMARAFVDNTINQVLDDMGFTPPQENGDDVISFDIIPNVQNREGIEDQAVLMAIQSHGLQKPCVCSHSMPNSVPVMPNVPFHHRPSSPLCTPSTSQSQSDKYTGETDFLAQAVAVAIQKKGLGSYSQADRG